MIKLELLSMPGCTHCAAAKEVIEKIKGDYPEMDEEKDKGESKGELRTMTLSIAGMTCLRCAAGGGSILQRRTSRRNLSMGKLPHAVI